MWNISHGWIVYVLFLVSLVIFALGVYRRVEFWKKGKDDNERFSDLSRRLVFMLREVLFQKRVRQSGFRALFHSLVF